MSETAKILMLLELAKRDAISSSHLLYALPTEEREQPSVRIMLEMFQSLIFRLERRIKAHENAVEASDAHS